MEQEIWKSVSGYDGIYEVSNLGEVRCLLKSSNGKIYYRETPLILSKHFNNRTGYYSIQFGEWGRRSHKRFPIHRLVALHFVENPNNLPEVNHEDGDKSNNKASNLSWATREQNIQHGFKNGLISTPKGVDHIFVKLTEEQVMMIFHSPTGPRQLSRELNIPYSTVASIKNGSSWNHITGMPFKRKHKSTQ